MMSDDVEMSVWKEGVGCRLFESGFPVAWVVQFLRDRSDADLEV